jgi:hypothetical protein
VVHLASPLANILADVSSGSKPIEWGNLAQWASAILSTITLLWTFWLVYYRDYRSLPRLTIEPIPDVQQQDPPLNDPSAMWVRFRVTNCARRRTAKNCRAYLIRLRRLQGEQFVDMIPQPYNDVRQLTWTHSPPQEAAGRDILPGTTQRFDLLATTRPPEGDFLQLQTIPLLLDMTIVQPGTYLAEVQVSADEAAPQTMRFRIGWDGHWNTVTANQHLG